MPQYDSPLGSKKIAGQPALREFEVPDESGYSGPTGGGNFAPSVTRRYSSEPMDENAIREFQERLQAQADPDSNLSDVEIEIKRQREAKRNTGKERLNDGARRRIDRLIGMTRGNRTAEIEGNTYVFQTLKSKEMRDAMSSASEFDGTIQSVFEIRRQLLARSLVEIAGVEISQFVGSADLEAKFALIDEMDEALLNRLYNEYLLMAKESRDRFTIKTPEEAQEVVEDLKK
jgi:hypothetical protein